MAQIPGCMLEDGFCYCVGIDPAGTVHCGYRRKPMDKNIEKLEKIWTELDAIYNQYDGYVAEYLSDATYGVRAAIEELETRTDRTYRR